MIFLALIVSALAWLPTSFSVTALGLLAIAAFLSRCRWVGLLALCVIAQDLRVSTQVQRLWSREHPPEVCSGRAMVRALRASQPPDTVAVVRWLSSTCPSLAESDQTLLRVPYAEVRIGDVLEGRARLRPIVNLHNPGGWDSRRQALVLNVVAQGQWLGGSITPVPGPRQALRSRLEDWPQPLGGIALALLFGERVGLAAETYHIVSAMGLSHLLAISGLHVGLVLGSVWWVLGHLLSRWHPRRRLYGQTVVICLLGVALADWTLWSPSVSRAVGMAALAAILRTFGWRINLLSLLALTAIGLVAWDPLIGLSGGYWMSVGAVAAIAWLHGIAPLTGIWGLLRMQWFFSAVMNPLVTLSMGFAFPWLGFLCNLIVIPLLGPLILILIGLLVLDLAQWIGWLNDALTVGLDGVFWVLSHSLLSHPITPSALISCALIGGISVLPNCLPKGPLVLCVILVALLSPEHPPRRFDVVDVGQGSAAVLQLGSTRWLFDLGPGQPGSWDRLSEIMPLLDGAEDVRILMSHGDMDHVGAFESLRNARIPDAVIGGGRVSQRATPCLAGQTWSVDDVVIDVLWPDRSDYQPENRASCVVLITAEGQRVLLMGDADWFSEAQVIRALYERNLLGEIHVVVASHHGARDGSSPVFQQLVGADVVMISVGATNRFGHPHASVLEGWHAVGAQIYRTDRDGALTFPFDGPVRTWRTDSPTRW
jgi:competence protein ComEC